MENLFVGFEIIQPDRINDYNFPGVWAMFGIQKKNNPNNKYTCLNVGKSICIGEELELDFKRLKCLKSITQKIYKNQFNEEMFKYDDQPSRIDYLYNEISIKYNEIVTILIACQAENTYIIEKYFAYSTKAAYWVSNGRYSSNELLDNEKITRIRNDIDISAIDKSIIDKIDRFKSRYDEQ